ncbi:hypothetical protein ABLE93_25990 [Xanthobacter sp. KR7-65]|uniref:hypothetical protein n=1 Tax=Xanthobacter sp. KR7-65 TaxID=3156612 RepID=UPI0032B3ABA7
MGDGKGAVRRHLRRALHKGHGGLIFNPPPPHEIPDTPLATRAGLAYVPLSDLPALLAALAANARPRPVASELDIAPVPAGLALLLLAGFLAAQAVGVRRRPSILRRTSRP